MAMGTKIATCCYCGTRAALVLDKERHELVCSSCGAPLHDLKMLRTDAMEKPAKSSKSKAKHAKGYHPHAAPAAHHSRKSKPKKKKSKKGGFWKEAFDILDDIFD